MAPSPWSSNILVMFSGPDLLHSEDQHIVFTMPEIHHRPLPLSSSVNRGPPKPSESPLRTQDLTFLDDMSPRATIHGQRSRGRTGIQGAHHAFPPSNRRRCVSRHSGFMNLYTSHVRQLVASVLHQTRPGRSGPTRPMSCFGDGRKSRYSSAILTSGLCLPVVSLAESSF